ncbi:MAG: hypothetical protein NZM28_07325 [Fimbriimonadales bacterium]|nr:hypothetical protein [Fimbriimonadales bacterium]
MSALEIRTAGAVDDWGLLRWTNGDGDALPLKPPHADTTVDAPPAPFGVAYPAPLAGVGRVYLWADGFTARTASILLERELASRYIKAAGAMIKQYGRRGAPMADAETRLQQAQKHFSDSQWLESLAAGVQAAEQSVVSVARARLQRMHGRTAFLWGVCASDPSAAQIAIERLCPPLNLIHMAINDSDEAWRVVAQQAQGARLAIAASLADCNGGSNHAPNADALRNALTRYRGQARYWSVATRVHQFNPENGALAQLRELCEAARAVDFGIVRLLHGAQSLHHQQRAYPTLDACVQQDVPFESVQLEWYWYDGSLYDLDQLLERYGELGKPIHLTLHLPPDGRYSVFSRTEPLEWIEGAALIALSKPYVAALRVPLQTSQQAAGALDADGNPSEFWGRIAEIVAWNRSLQEQ